MATTALHHELNRWLSEKQRRELREAIAAHDRAIAELRALGRKARAEQRETCSARVSATRERARELYQRAVDVARAERAALVGEARGACRQEAAAIRLGTRARIAEHEDQKRARRHRHKAELRRDASARAREQSRTPQSRSRNLGESADAVRYALEVEAPELVAAWDRWGHKMRPTKRATRREVFLDWAHEHPQEVLAAREQDGRRASQRLAREQREALLAEVPF